MSANSGCGDPELPGAAVRTSCSGRRIQHRAGTLSLCFPRPKACRHRAARSFTSQLHLSRIVSHATSLQVRVAVETSSYRARAHDRASANTRSPSASAASTRIPEISASSARVKRLPLAESSSDAASRLARADLIVAAETQSCYEARLCARAAVDGGSSTALGLSRSASRDPRRADIALRAHLRLNSASLASFRTPCRCR